MARTLDHLRRGARIHSLAFAVHLSRGTDRPYDVTWNGLQYGRNDKSGVRGILAFCKAGVVALFFDERRLEAKPRKWDSYLAKAPPALLTHARREVIDTFDMGKGPLVTSAFWSDSKGDLVPSDGWEDTIARGAELSTGEMENPDQAVLAFAKKYALPKEAESTISRLFTSPEALRAPAAAKLLLTPTDRDSLGLLTTPAVRELLEGAAIHLA